MVRPVDVDRKLDVPKMLMLVNKVPTTFDLNEVRKRVEETYNATVAAVFPHSDEMMTLAGLREFSPFNIPTAPSPKPCVNW